MRMLPAIEAITEAAARAAEMGKSIHYSTGLSGVERDVGGQVIAGLAIMGRVARECGKFGVPMRYSCPMDYLIPAGQDIIKQGYLEGGREEMYDDSMVVYTTSQQRAFMASTVGYILGEKPAANMMFGTAYWETQVLSSTGALAGCLQIFGISRPGNMPLAACICDYTLLAEELFAGAAYVDGRQEQLATIQVSDWIKFIIFAILIIGLIAAGMGSNAIYNFVRW